MFAFELTSLLMALFLTTAEKRLAKYLVKNDRRLPELYVLEQGIERTKINCIFKCHKNPLCLSLSTSHLLCTLYLEDYRNFDTTKLQISQHTILYSMQILDCFGENGQSLVNLDIFSNQMCNILEKIDQPKWTESTEQEWDYVIENTCIGNDVLFVHYKSPITVQ